MRSLEKSNLHITVAVSRGSEHRIAPGTDPGHFHTTVLGSRMLVLGAARAACAFPPARWRWLTRAVYSGGAKNVLSAPCGCRSAVRTVILRPNFNRFRPCAIIAVKALEHGGKRYD